MIVAIHQPNFFPWLGYFDKILRSDIFIFLDYVQFPKSARGVWSNRVKLLIGGEAKWATAPVDRTFHGVRAINEMTFSSAYPWRDKLLNTLKHNYKKAPYFHEVMPWLEPLILNPENNVARYNTWAITTIAEQLGISRDKFYWSSNLPYAGKANEMLIRLTKAVGGSCYMCGGGAEGYQDDRIVESAGLKIVYQNFQHPVYEQFNSDSFVSRLSIVDALMNCGFSGVNQLFNNDM